MVAYAAAAFAVAGLMRTEGTAQARAVLVNGMPFVQNRMGNAPQDSGSFADPHPAWRGWTGEGYYIFPSVGLETGIPVRSIEQLDQFNEALFRRPYGFYHPGSQAPETKPLQIREPEHGLADTIGERGKIHGSSYSPMLIGGTILGIMALGFVGSLILRPRKK